MIGIKSQKLSSTTQKMLMLGVLD